MENELFETFFAVVESMNFRKAADLLFVSSSTISRNISKLEELLGVQLFVRNSKTVTLTPAGELFNKKGSRIRDMKEELIQELQTMEKPLKHRIRVSCISLNSSTLFSAYSRFVSENPNVGLNIVCKYFEPLPAHENVENTSVGITFSFFIEKSLSADEMNEYDYLVIDEGSFVVACSPNHRLADRDSLTMKEVISEQPLISSPIDKEFPKVVPLAINNDTNHQPGALRSNILKIHVGNDIMLMPIHTAEANNSGYKTIPIIDIDTVYRIVMFWRKSSNSAYLRKLIGMIRDELPPEIANQTFCPASD